MPPATTVSVIIPTYNRIELLREVLDSLAQQTYPSDRFEVIIVDDGSTDGTKEIAADAFPFALRYFWQSNQGDAIARNLGVQQSQADFLVFLDDDILVEPGYLTHIIHAHGTFHKMIVRGTCNLWLTETSPFSHSSSMSPIAESIDTITKLQFRDVFSNNMSLRREAYFEIGMMQALDFPGSSMWCDLDFCYRAHQQGFVFRRSAKAVCWHRDYASRTLNDQKKRMRTAAYRAVVLFQKYPDLSAHLPMFYDKTPIVWNQDSPRAILRKLVRSLVSSRTILWGIEQVVHALERTSPASTILPPLYRYIIAAYIFLGYREGLREFGQVGN